MSRRLPSIPALLALEAAARHQSFAKAAQELSLSEGAISRQIGKLEEFLGVRLFNRAGNRVELSSPGMSYAAQIRTALADIERHTRQVMTDAQGSTSLEIGVIPTLASRWLIPRIAQFRERHPDIEINLRERTQPFSLEESDLHAAINYDHPIWHSMRVQPLFEAPMVAVCHPQLADEASERMPLLHKHASPFSWTRYSMLSGLPLCAAPAGPTYDRYALLIEAAKAGIGMALVPHRYVEEELHGRQLVAPWPAIAELCERYVLVTRPDTGITPALTKFERWLIDEAVVG
ncbi:LysR substrate-binding domain-containing protein [Pseudomonas defluvii]|uniref:LysR substrate-binding domain-containing protein n=1 Tax=Pseudomonas defluvii TaxID=1876757 RepID=UPI000811257E|nr:LysR substrate-binding domain-containing protein [Pseudomonas defluvii]